jgi:hypothetical protein
VVPASDWRPADPFLRSLAHAFDQIGTGDPNHLRDGLHREPSFGRDGGSRSCFFDPVACSSASLRILNRWEYHAHNFLGFVQLACLVILFKRF